jgi:hypothetical protein
MSGEAQIGCYLLPAEAAALSVYARSLELSRPKLCGLLVVRAVRSDRLASLVGRQRGSEGKAGTTRVTTRVSKNETKERFILAASILGLGADDAAAFVFRDELEQRWLETAIAAK